MIDQTTATRIDELKKLSAANGWDLMETLDRHGLLLTVDAHAKASASGLWGLHNLLNQLDAAGVLYYRLGRLDGTALDIYRSVMEILEQYIDGVTLNLETKTREKIRADAAA